MRGWRNIWRECSRRSETTDLARGGSAFLGFAWREGACAFVARPNVQAIEQAKVRIAHYFETPQQRQPQRAADSSGDFQGERESAQRLDADVNARFLFSRFHYVKSRVPGARVQLSSREHPADLF
jgi:hypothetical protein